MRSEQENFNLFTELSQLKEGLNECRIIVKRLNVIKKTHLTPLSIQIKVSPEEHKQQLTAQQKKADDLIVSINKTLESILSVDYQTFQDLLTAQGKTEEHVGEVFTNFKTNLQGSIVVPGLKNSLNETLSKLSSCITEMTTFSKDCPFDDNPNDPPLQKFIEGFTKIQGILQTASEKSFPRQYILQMTGEHQAENIESQAAPTGPGVTPTNYDPNAAPEQRDIEGNAHTHPNVITSTIDDPATGIEPGDTEVQAALTGNNTPESIYNSTTITTPEPRPGHQTRICESLCILITISAACLLLQSNSLVKKLIIPGLTLNETKSLLSGGLLMTIPILCIIKKLTCATRSDADISQSNFQSLYHQLPEEGYLTENNHQHRQKDKAKVSTPSV